MNLMDCKLWVLGGVAACNEVPLFNANEQQEKDELNGFGGRKGFVTSETIF